MTNFGYTKIKRKLSNKSLGNIKIILWQQNMKVFATEVVSKLTQRTASGNVFILGKDSTGVKCQMKTISYARYTKSF